MARFVDDRTQVGVFGQLALTVGDFVERIKTSFVWTRVFRETYDELNRLSNRELEDLGIHRSQIARIAREAADDWVA